MRTSRRASGSTSISVPRILMIPSAARTLKRWQSLNHGRFGMLVVAADLLDVDPEVAHHAFDQVGPEAIVARETVPFRDRQLAPPQPLRISAEHHLVLDVALRQPANRRRAEGEEHVRAVGRVALEIAPQRAPVLRDRHRVAGQRVMVEPDAAVTGGDERRPDGFRLLVASARFRKARLRDLALMGSISIAISA